MRQSPDVAGAMRRSAKAARQELEQLHMPIPPLMHDWKDFIYTDGSVLAADSHTFPGIGAAVYVPAHEEMHIKEKIIAIDCYYESEPAC
jgi:hypothetical protein